MLKELTVPTATDPAPDYAPALAYVASFWDRLIRFHPHDTGTLIGMPRPYLVPAADPKRPLFQEMYYWDSFFVALGLVGTPHDWLVLDMTENMAALIDRFGFVPNGNRYYFTSRSQPPFFTQMMRLAHAIKTERHEDDATEYLRRMAALAGREHETCWLGTKHPHERCMFRGLSRFHDINYSHFLASCESGWDHSARCDGDRPGTEAGRWMDFVPVCLNSVLYVRELDLSWAYGQLGDAAGNHYWFEAAEERARTMRELYWDDERQFFLDYDWKRQERCGYVSLAGFYPLWAGFATQEQADAVVAKWLPQFLHAGGLVTSLHPFPHRQWGHPNGWAPLQWIVAAGLERYGYAAEAREVRLRWCATCAATFAETGTFLEKYNVVEPNSRPECGVYGLIEGFGWSNAVFADFVRKLAASGEPCQ